MMRFSSVLGALGLLSLFVLCQVFFVMLVISDINKYSQDNQKKLISMSVEATAYQLSLVTGLRQSIKNYNKSFDALYHLKFNTNTQDAFIISPEGEILIGSSILLSKKELAQFSVPKNITKVTSWESNNNEFFVAPILKSGVPIAFLVAAQNVPAYLLAQHQKTHNSILSDAIVGSIISLFIMAFALYALPRLIPHLLNRFKLKKLPKKQQLFLKNSCNQDVNSPKKSAKRLMLPFVVAQLVFLCWLMPSISNLVYQHSRNSVIAASDVVFSSFQHVVRLGVNLEQVSDIDVFLDNFKERMPTLGGISVLSDDNKLIAGDALVNNGLYKRDVPLFNSSGSLGSIVIWSGAMDFLVQSSKLALTILTFLIVSCLSVFELSIVFFCERNRLQYRSLSRLHQTFGKEFKHQIDKSAYLRNVAQKESVKNSYEHYETVIYRPISFMCSCIMFTTLSIMPFMMSSFAQDFHFLSEFVLMSLPITVQMLAIALSTLAICVVHKRLNFKEYLFGGMVLVAIGMLIGYIADNGWVFLSSQAVFGLGYGAIIAGLKHLVVTTSIEKERKFAVSNFFNGLYVGILCGCICGGLIADHLSYQTVFLVTSIVACFVLPCIFYLMKTRKFKAEDKQISTNIQAQIDTQEVPATQGDISQSLSTQDRSYLTELLEDKSQIHTKESWQSFLRTPKVLCILLLQVVPSSMIAVGFINFFLPVYCHEHNFVATTVGQFIFVYILLVILISTVIRRCFLQYCKRSFLLLGLSLLCSSFIPLVFSIDNSFFILIVGLMLLSLATALNKICQPLAIANMEITARYDEDRAFALLEVFIRLGQVFGAILVAYLLNSFAQTSLPYLTVIGILLTVCFVGSMLLLSRFSLYQPSNTTDLDNS